MSASGEAVCCVIIFQYDPPDEVPIDWKYGIDIMVDPLLDEYGNTDYNLNIGEGKCYPGVLKCKYNGKEVDCRTFCS